MIVIDSQYFNSFREMEHIISAIRSKFKRVKLLSRTDNMVFYQYDDGRKDY